MSEPLYDYSGDFDPSFDYGKISKEGLVGLLATYSNYIRKLDGHWYLSAMNKCGDDVAYDCDVAVWGKLMRLELRIASEMMNIRGDGLSSVAKYFQVSPWFWNFDFSLDLKENERLIVTFVNCPTLLALEKEGLGREKKICRELEQDLFETIAHYFDPRISVIPVQVPPRDVDPGFCCRWEFRVREGK
jgi:hypothetical protein